MSEKTIMNIKKEFGKKYKIEVDPAWKIPNQEPEDKEWLHIIPCHRGGEGAHIFTFGYRESEQALGFFGTSGKTKRKLLKAEDVSLHIEGDTEYIVTFPLRAFSPVAAIVKPKLRRRMKAAQRKRFVDAGRDTRFLSVGNQ